MAEQQGQGGQGAQPAAASPWGELSPELSGFVQNKGWKGPSDALTSYVNLERLRGVPEAELIRIPRGDDADAWNTVYGRLGRPESPDKYDLGEYAPQDGQIDLRPLAHKYGLNQNQAAGLAREMAELVQGHTAQSLEAKAAQQEADVAALKREWGGEYEANVAAGKRGRQALGWDDATMDKLEDALGTRGAIELAVRIGRGLREDGAPGPQGLQGGGAMPFGMTREAAQARYAQMNADPAFQARLRSQDRSVRMAAAEERAAISKHAFPDD